MNRFALILLTLGFVSVPGPGVATELDFYRDIYPFLKANCVSCHNKTTTKAGLNMETPELMIAGGDSGPSIVPGKSSESLLVEASAHSDFIEMPPSKNKTGARPLNESELAKLKQWIDEGAKSSTQQTRQVQWQALSTKVDPIYSVSMTKDGRYVSCGRGNRIFVYDLASHQLIDELTDSRDQGSGTAHRALVNSLAFSPDGNWIASGSFRELKIWRKVQSQEEVRKPKASQGIIASAPCPNGTHLVALGEHGALLQIEHTSGRVIRKIDSAIDTAHSLFAVSPDSTKVAGFSENARLRVWQLADGKIVAEQQPNSSNPEIQDAPTPTALAWSSEGDLILAATSLNEIQIFEFPQNGTAFDSPRIWKDAPGINSIANAPGDRIVTGGTDNNVRVWNLRDGKILSQFGAATINLAVSPDGKHIATGTEDGRVRLWSIDTSKQLFDLRGTPAITAQIAELGQSIDREKLEETFQRNRAAAIAKTDTGLADLLKKTKDAVVAMKKKIPEAEKAIPPTKEARVAAEKKVAEAMAALKNPPEGKTQKVLESELEKQKLALLAAQTKEHDAIAALAAYRSNVTDAEAKQKEITEEQAANQKAIKEANTIEKKSKELVAEKNTALAALKKQASSIGPRPLALAFSSDSSRIAASCADGSIRIWTVLSGNPIEQTQNFPATQSANLIAQDDGSFFCTIETGESTTTAPVARWRLQHSLGGDPMPNLFSDRVEALAFSPDGKTLAAGDGEPSRTGHLTLFDVATGEVSAEWKDRHTDSIVSLDFSPDGKSIATGSADKIARVIDIQSGKQINLFEGHTHYVTGVSFRSDGRVLASAGADGVVNSWDLAKGERLKKIEGWTKEVTSLQFIGSTDRIVTSAGDNRVRIVTDVGSQIRAIADLPDFMQSAAASPDGKWIVAGGQDSYLRIWNGSDGKEVAAFGMQ